MATRERQDGERSTQQRSVRTKLRILKAAEQVIADNGFEGASLREITSAACVDLALVHYHFGSKDGLYVAVLARRDGAINRARLQRLSEARERAHPHPIEVEAIVDAFLDPIFDRLMTKAPGWRNWGRIVAQLNSSPPVLRHQRQNVDDVHRVFIAEFSRALPDLRPGSLYFRHIFLVSVLLEILHATERLYVLSAGAEDMRDLSLAKAEARAFVLGGLTANPAATSQPAAPR